MGIEITFRFRETLANIFKREIEELGFDTSSLTTSDDVLQSYCSYTYRLIENDLGQFTKQPLLLVQQK